MMAAVLIGALVLSVDIFEERFAAANAAYENGDYVAAASGYEELVEGEVVAPELFYNLANAYFRQGQLGNATANYERALQLDPGFEAARENLRGCVRQTERRLERPLPPEWEQSLLFWHYNLRQGTTRVLAVLFWVLFWAVLGILQWKRVPYLRVVSVLLGALALAFGASVWVKARPNTLAVANVEVLPVRYGTAEDQTVRFELFDGDRVTVDRVESEWARVTTISGERGWARRNGLVLVGPPYERPSEIMEDRPPVAGEKE